MVTTFWEKKILMSKLKVYVMKEADLNKWADAGYDIQPMVPVFGGMAIFKETKVDFKDKFPQAMISNYNDPNKQKYFRNSMTGDYLHSIGVNFYKTADGASVVDQDNETFRENVTKIRLAVFDNDEDKMLCLCPYDWTCPIRVYAAKLIYPYMKEEIDNLLKKGLISIRYVETNA